MEIEHIEGKCTGCWACQSICPHQAIEMRADQWGYLRPQINHQACVECGLCDRACPEIHPAERKSPLSVLAAVASAETAAGCSSGGAASVIARQVISGGGIVYGCSQPDGCDIAHRRVPDSSALEAMKGSKYVHSAIGDTFRECRADLLEGKDVLFIGTPCQVAGLRKYLGKEYPRLCTIDLVCHGVPSLQLLADELHLLRRKHPITEYPRVSFRDKSSGKVRFGFYLSDGGRKVYSRNYPKNFYISGFMSGLFFRPNCFSCPYACAERTGDITLGDFWGLGKVEPSKLRPSAGVSLVLVNSRKGAEVMEAVSDRLTLEERTLDEAVKGNAQLRRPFVRPADYEGFHDLYCREGYESACYRYLDSYIRENTRYMQIEEHPTMMLPYRIYLKLKGFINK